MVNFWTFFVACSLGVQFVLSSVCPSDVGAEQQDVPDSIMFSLLQTSLQLKEAKYLYGGQPSVDHRHSQNTSVRALLSSRSSVLYAKFHKVAGTTFANTLNAMTGQSRSCSKQCWDDANHPSLNTWEANLGSGKCSASEWEHSCTGHRGLGILQIVSAANEHLPLQDPNDLGSPSNLIPADKRVNIILQAAPYSSAWLASNETFASFVILRSPVEKLRSEYYWHSAPGQPSHTHASFKVFLQSLKALIVGRSSQELAQVDMNSLRLCCEFVTYLGNFSVEKAKLSLATMFDHVGLQENLNASLVTVAHLFGKPYQSLLIRSEKDDGGSKLDWTEEELALAHEVVGFDQEIYDFAKSLYSRRLLSIWGSQQTLDNALSEYLRIAADTPEEEWVEVEDRTIKEQEAK